MKSPLLPLALAAAGLSALPVIGHAQATDGAFINVNMGRASLDRGPFDDHDTGYGGNAGYRWAVSPSTLIGFEGGYVNLGKYSAPASATFFPPIGTPPTDPTTYTGRGSTDLNGWTIGANGHFNLSPNWYIGGHAGFFRASVDSRFRITGPDNSVAQYHYNDNADGWYAGAGLGYDFTHNFSLGLNYDYYRADKNGFKVNPDIVSVSGEYRF